MGDEQATDERIRPALHPFLAGDAAALRAAVLSDPEVVNLPWQGNTSIEWATQPPHGVPEAVVQVLIDHGAHLDRALNLAGCWNRPELCRQLLAAGANPAARADADITPLESAAHHGSTDSADVLVTHGLHRPGLWLAAATGRLDLVRSWVSPRGVLLDDAGPYRPDWAKVGRSQVPKAGDEPDDIIGEALVFAAANSRTGVVDYLLDAGVDIDSRPSGNITGLHLATQFHKPDMVGLLVDRGASTNIVDDEFGSDAAGWAVACNDGSPPATTIIRLLESPRPLGR